HLTGVLLGRLAIRLGHLDLLVLADGDRHAVLHQPLDAGRDEALHLPDAGPVDLVARLDVAARRRGDEQAEPEKAAEECGSPSIHDTSAPLAAASGVEIAIEIVGTGPSPTPGADSARLLSRTCRKPTAVSTQTTCLTWAMPP